jgi:hypothetical protein
MGGDRQGICLPAYGLRVLEKFTRIDNGLQFTPDSALGAQGGVGGQEGFPEPSLWSPP